MKKCNIPGCFVGCAEERKKLKEQGIKISVFTLPRDPALLKEWKKALSVLDTKLTDNYRVCELHFNYEEIRKFSVTTRADGTVNTSRKKRVSLRFGAVPSIFQNAPSYPTMKLQRKEVEESSDLKPETRRKYPISVKNRCNISNTDAHIKKVENGSSVEDYFTYYKLLENLHLVKKPNNLWGITPIDNYIICAKWSEELVVEKRVIIENNLKIRVFVNKLQLNITDQMTFTCINDISTLLKVVDGCHIIDT